ncbi:MAG: FAD-dependent oxidoreductase, partial [Thermomicrobiales bacterium]|nr:FAD-dependent oxidoreductase [Thermomicrobiales bacterium]
MRERSTDVVMVGGGLGGGAAAMAAARAGWRVILTEESDWLGGQLTAQAVPPDEHPWIERVGCTASYRRFREGIRAFYRAHYPLTESAAADPFLNPGQGEVSPLCHEPRVGLAVLEAMLQPFRAGRRIEIMHGVRPVAVEVEGDRVRSVTVRDSVTAEETVLVAPFVLDASELGDLIPLAGVEHVIGAESREETGEPHALPGPAQPLDQQAISWCFALDHLPVEDHTIERP